jgi:hypothetical protein
MKWNDRPTYAQVQKISRDEPFLGYRFKENMPTPSDIQVWYMQENEKKRQGLENEIDIAQIKAALTGVKNKWYKIVQDHPIVFDKKTKDDKIKWADIEELLKYLK